MKWIMKKNEKKLAALIAGHKQEHDAVRSRSHPPVSYAILCATKQNEVQFDPAIIG